MLAEPIQMNFGPEGRLWVATSEIYPQIKPGQDADDKVLVLEDSTGAAHVAHPFMGGGANPSVS